MINTINVNIISIEAKIFSGLAKFIILPGKEGELGIYPRHTPLITHINPGVIRIKTYDQIYEELIFVAGGFLEVQPDCVTVLADTAVRAEDLDEAKAIQAKKIAKEALVNRHSKIDYISAQAQLAIAAAQLSAIQRLRYKRS